MVTVIVPVYNGQKSIYNCLQSLAQQKLYDIEVIVVDNNSTDQTSDIVTSFCKTDGRFRYLFCKKQGVSCTRNMGLDAANGDYIFFCDSDDLLADDALSDLLNASRLFGTDITFGNIMLCKNGTKTILDKKGNNTLVSSCDIPKMFLEKMPTYLMYFVFKLYKKSFIDNYHLRFNETMIIGEDLLFNLNAYEYVDKIYYLKKPLYFYRIKNNGLNTRYHIDFIDNKIMLHNTIKTYLMKYGLLNDSYYAVFLNDVFSMIVNEQKSENCDIEKVLELDCVKELSQRKILGYLSFLKKIIFICIRLKLKHILFLSAKFWIRSNPK